MAVQWIGSLSDAELLDYLPQLVQVQLPYPEPLGFLHLPSEAKIPGKVISADLGG